MCLEFNFTYAVRISSGSVNKYVTSRDAVTSLKKNFIENDRVFRKNEI